MNTIYDVQQILKKFGTYIYTGNRLGDLELMELEIQDLYEAKFVNTEEYNVTKLIIRKEIRRLQKNKA